MKRLLMSMVVVVVATGTLVAASLPAGSITGGTNDSPTAPKHPNVGLILFYLSDGRFRCSGTLVSERVVLTAGHCSFGAVGKVIVTFDTDVARSLADARNVIPRARDDDGTGLVGSGYNQGLWIVEYGPNGEPLKDSSGNVVRHPYPNNGFADGTQDKSPVWITGTALAHPRYSDFTDVKNWNDTGVIVLDKPVRSIKPATLAPANYLDQYSQNQIAKQLFRTVGYGTEVRQADSGPQKPAPMSYPLRRQYTDEKGQKLTPQILQLNGNENDPFGGGGTCFGDSGGPAFHGGFVVGDTSYGYTENCRYLGGYQRVDIPVVRNWLLCVLAVMAKVPSTATATPAQPTPGAAATDQACGSLKSTQG